MNPDAKSDKKSLSDSLASPPTRSAKTIRSIPNLNFLDTFASLRNRNYLFLWIGMQCLMGGIQMQMVARGYLVYELTSRPALLGIVHGGSAIPILILSLWGGAIADRIDRKKIIQGGQVLNAGIALVVSVLIATGQVTWVHLLIASMIQGGMWAFMMPARQAIIPQIAGQKNLTNALAINAAGMSAMTLVSPALAGILYGAFNAQGAYYVVTIMSLLACLFTSLVKYSGPQTTETNTQMVTHIKEGLKYISANHLVLLLLVIGLTTTLLAMPFRFLLPVFVVDVYGKGPEALGLLNSIIGVGSLAGSIFIASLGKWNRGLLIIIGCFMSCFGLLLIAAFPFYIAAVFIMIILGLGDAIRRTLNQTLILEIVEDQYRGRVMSVFMMIFGLMPLGVVPGGLAIELLGGQAAIAILAVGLLVVSVVLLITQKQLREFQ